MLTTDANGIATPQAGVQQEVEGQPLPPIRRRRRGEKRPLPRSVVDFLREARRRGVDVRTEFDE
jgi:hypothetical protein